MPARVAFTIEQMRTFLAFAEHEHVSRAAASLHLSQGAVTQQLHNFERALGLQVLERVGRGVRLTDAGRSLVANCQGAARALDLVGEAALAIRSLETGSLHIGATPTCGTYFMPRLVGGFLHLYPAVQLEAIVEPTADVNAGVRTGVLDCGLIEGRQAPDLTNLVIGTDELVLVAAPDHPLAAAEHLTSSVLGKHRYVGRGSRWAAENTARQMIGEAYESSPGLTLDHTDYVRAAAVAGLGYAALPLEAIEDELRDGTLKRLPWPPRKRTIHAVRRRSKGGPMLEEFWRFLAATSAT